MSKSANTELAKELSSVGFVHVTGLPTTGYGPIQAYRESLGKFTDRTTSVLVTNDGEVWIGHNGSSQIAMCAKHAIRADDCSLLKLLAVTMSVADMGYILMRMANPYENCYNVYSPVPEIKD